MSDKLTFTIRRAFLIPLGLLLIAQILLLAVSIAQGQATARIILIGGIVLLMGGLFVENLFRRLVMDEETITAFRLFRRRTLRFSELTSLEAVTLRRRIFISLWKDEKFLLISNAYAGFSALFAGLVSRVPREIVSEEAFRLAEDPPQFNGHVVICWMALLFSLLVLWQQLIGAY
jgi:uncharacterized membrane protein